MLTLSEVRQKQISYDITHMWNLKHDTSELIYQTEETHRHKKQTHDLPKGKGVGEG